MRRAMASVALSISEGCGSQGENRNARYFNALGSAREVGTALEVDSAASGINGNEGDNRAEGSGAVYVY